MHLQTSVMVGWRKGWASKAHTYLVEIGDGTVWLGRLGSGGAYWGPTPGLPEYTIRQSSRAAGMSVVGGAAGGALARAGVRKVLERYRAEISENERRYHADGRAALAGDKHTAEWPLTEFGDARVVRSLPATAPSPMHGLGPGFVAVTLGGKNHFFAGLPGGADADAFHASLLEAAQR